MLTPHINRTRRGDLVSTWELKPIPFETAEEADIEVPHQVKKNWLGTLDNRFVSHETRWQTFEHDRLGPVRSGKYETVFDEQWNAHLTAQPFRSNRIFITLVMRPRRVERRGFLGMPLHAPRSREQLEHDEARDVAEFEEAAAVMQRMLHAWKPRRLGDVERGGVTFTEFGEFAGLLVNGHWSPVRAGPGSLHRRLATARASFRSGTVELRSIGQERYATMLEPLDFGEGIVEPGVLSAALYEPVEYIETLTFAPLARHDAVERLKLMKRQLLAAEDAAAAQVEAMDRAIAEAADGQGKWGEMHGSYAVFGDTVESSRSNAAKLASGIAETTGVRFARCDLVADRAWWAQCPGNMRWRQRTAHVSAGAFATLAANHGFYAGKRHNNPWGDPLLLTKALNGQKLCISPHKSPPGEASEGKKYPGLTLILGPNGTGKTVLEGAFLLQSRRWNPAPDIVVLDKDCSLELVLRAMRGNYRRMAEGVPTGINPFQWPDSPAHRAFLFDLVLAMVADATWHPSAADRKELDRAINALFGTAFSVVDRGVSALCGLLGKGGILERLERWCEGKQLGWVFDEAPDTLDPNDPVTGFDYTQFLPKAEIRTPILMVLLQFVENKTDGRRLMLVMEEAWKPLKDPVLAAFAHDKAKTIRKKNGLPILTTQEPGDLANDMTGDTLVTQAASIVCFHDPNASPKAYLDGLRLTPAEYAVVRRLGDTGGRHFFFKQGSASCIADFDLSGLDEHLWILSGSEDNVRLLDEIRAEVGDDPDDWMPVLFARIRAREVQQRTGGAK
jgi:type IV secretion system protein VirB4